MHGRGDKRRNRETLGERNGQHIVPGGFDCADPDKDQRERPAKFCEQRNL
jgi:hypothetical protein